MDSLPPIVVDNGTGVRTLSLQNSGLRDVMRYVLMPGIIVREGWLRRLKLP